MKKKLKIWSDALYLAVGFYVLVVLCIWLFS